MDINWIVDQALYNYENGMCLCQALCNIVDGIAYDESDTIVQYQKAKDAVIKICSGEENEKLCCLICGMIDRIIADERDHNASCMKASAILSGYSEPKPEEFNKSEKEANNGQVSV